MRFSKKKKKKQSSFMDAFSDSGAILGLDLCSWAWVIDCQAANAQRLGGGLFTHCGHVWP